MDDFLKKIVLYTMGIALILSGLSYILFKSDTIALGFVIGAITRCTGFYSINKMVNKINSEDSKAQAKGFANYVVRLAFYGVVIWISITRHINIFSLLLGFVILNIVIIVMSYRKGGYQ